MFDLYVMQNQFGLVKIGRSCEPELRRRALERTDECKLTIVAILEGRGHEEEEVHCFLQRHRITGEWFEGDERALTSIGRKLKLPKNTVWPFRFEPRRAAEWIRRVEAVRDQQARVRNFSRVMRLLKNAKEGSVHLDAHVWFVLHPNSEFGIGLMPQPSVDAHVGLFCDDDGCWQFREVVPRYTRDVDAALSVWPEQRRAKQWTGTALECSIAGLAEERKTWGKTPTTPSGKPRFHGYAWNRPPPDARNRILDH